MENSTIILDDLNVDSKAVTYAGFWQRFLAMLIDYVPIVIVSLITMKMGVVGSIINLVVGVLYYGLMESSSYQGTLGKIALGLKVTTEQNETLSFGQALGRYFMKIVSGLILLIGYFMMLWSDKKQCLHDKVVGAIVVKK